MGRSRPLNCENLLPVKPKEAECAQIENG